MMRWYTLLLLFSLGPLFGQDDQATFNSQQWKELPELGKTYLILGYITGFKNAHEWEMCSKNVDASLSVGEWTAGVNLFYANPRNASVQFPMAMLWVRMKALGVSPDELVHQEKRMQENKMHAPDSRQ